MCAAYLVSHKHATRSEEADVSLVSKESAGPSTRPMADAPAAGSAPITAEPAQPVAPAAPASTPANFTVKQAEVERSFAAAAQSMGVDAGTTALLVKPKTQVVTLAR